MREQVAAADAGDDFDVWPDCWDTFIFFIRDLSGEWNWVGGMSTARTGIPSDRIESAMRLKPVPPKQRAELYADLKAMERAVLTADRELAKKQKKE